MYANKVIYIIILILNLRSTIFWKIQVLRILTSQNIFAYILFKNIFETKYVLKKKKKKR